MDLSHWDLFNAFTAYEAACLAAGVDPALTTISAEDSARVSVIERRINEAFDMTLVMAAGFNSDGDIDPTKSRINLINDYISWDVESSATIISNELYQYMSQCITERVMFDPREFDFKETKFNREVLYKWFNAARFKPAYKFMEEKQPEFNLEEKQVKIGNGLFYKTDSLSYLNQAASIFWDKDKVVIEDATTHPINADVAKWLVGKGYSQSLADKAASIIRPEWATKGKKPDK